MSKHDKLYLEMAKAWSRASKAEKMKVGALIVKDRRIISDGYNGTPSSFPNSCEYPISANIQDMRGSQRLKTRPEVLHAEANAILKLARSTESTAGATLYLTVPPCLECAKLIIQARIVRVVYAAPHKEDGLALLHKAKIKTELIQ